MFIIIKITKDEMFYLTGQKGIKFGESGVSHTHTKYQHYYLCESRQNIYELNKYRREKISETKWNVNEEKKNRNKKNHYNNKNKNVNKENASNENK